MHDAFTERIVHRVLFPSGLEASLQLVRRDGLVQPLAKPGKA